MIETTTKTLEVMGVRLEIVDKDDGVIRLGMVNTITDEHVSASFFKSEFAKVKEMVDIFQ